MLINMVDTRRRVRISKTSTRRKKRVGVAKKRVGGAKDKKTNVKKTAVTAVKKTGGRVDRETAWKDIEKEMKNGQYTDIDVIEKGWFFNRKVRVGLPSETLQKAIQDAMDNNIYSDRTSIVHSSDSRAAKKTCKNEEGYSVTRSYKKDGWEGSALNIFGSKYQKEKATCVKRKDKEMINRIDVLSRKGNLRTGNKNNNSTVRGTNTNTATQTAATQTAAATTPQANTANPPMEVKTDPANNFQTKIQPELNKNENKEMKTLWNKLRKKKEWEKPENKADKEKLETFFKNIDSTATVVEKPSGGGRTAGTASARAPRRPNNRQSS